MRSFVRSSALALALALVAMVPAAHAVQPDEMLRDPAQEARARSISEELRCLVCQNQSIDDSDAPLAHDLRVLVRERITAGDDDLAVKNYLVARYGEFVLLKPRFSLHTALLWLMPFAVLIVGVIAVVTSARRRRRGHETPLTADEKARLDEILKTDP